MEFLGKTISGKFTIPSGIITVTLDVIKKIAEEIPQIGVLTTKSIGPEVRLGNPEPVYAQINKDKFTNAVGLANPGCEAFAKELATLELPKDKFLLISIFGGTPEEFATVAKAVEPYADGLELNFSCPHAEGLGQAICSSGEIASTYLKAVKEVTDKPVLCKLSPNIDNIKEVTSALIQAGADGFSAINTVGPEEYKEPISGEIVLAHKTGGISGKEVVQIGLEKVKLIKEAMTEINRDLPIIGMGGISSKEDIDAYEKAGANIIGIGTALTGLSTIEIKQFFANATTIKGPQCKIDDNCMKFSELTLEKVDKKANDLVLHHYKEKITARPGQFFFLWKPGGMEKPFAAATIDPVSFAIRVMGEFTTAMSEMIPGDKIMIRGPYGNGYTVMEDKTLQYHLIGGGTGIAPLYHLALELNRKGIPKENIHVFLGGRNADQIYLVEEFGKIAHTHISTDDGSLGFKGFVTQALEDYLQNNKEKTSYNYICGPEKMMKAAFDIVKEYPHKEIEASMERYMKCGVGICGICSMDGMRTCVDGTIFKKDFLERSKFFGKLHRKKTGELEEI
jgi:dihydroorotate dehydrogenase (NAD+) catalytic subunit